MLSTGLSTVIVFVAALAILLCWVVLQKCEQLRDTCAMLDRRAAERVAELKSHITRIVTLEASLDSFATQIKALRAKLYERTRLQAELRDDIPQRAVVDRAAVDPELEAVLRLQQSTSNGRGGE